MPMRTRETICDQCGKVHDTPEPALSCFDERKTSLISVPLIVDGKCAYYDFCNQNCLRLFLTELEQISR